MVVACVKEAVRCCCEKPDVRHTVHHHATLRGILGGDGCIVFHDKEATRFGNLTVVSLNIQFFWDVIPCRSVSGPQNFEGRFRL
jgi:hypothetical protein